MNADLTEQIAYIDSLLAPAGWTRYDDETWASWMHPNLMVNVVYHPGRWSVHVTGQPSSHTAINSRTDIQESVQAVNELCTPAPVETGQR